MNTPLPDWPAAMSAEMAARYLSLSETSFRLAMQRDGVRPLRPTRGRRVWRRADLDAWLARLAGAMEPSAGNNPWHQT